MKEVFMKRAIELAMRGRGFTSPNPCVGALIVKGDEIIAEAWHKKAGEEHAEILAIKMVMEKSGIVSVDLEPTLFRNAILYVTLEPCAHVGKTPSCARAIVAAGFKKVCIGMKDPFNKVNGKGIKILKDAGIDVEVCKVTSSIAMEIRELNQPFIKWVQEGLPYLVMKSGMSLDGKIATSGGESKWITSAESRNDSRLERSLCDAVIVGAGTVLADDPELAAHDKFKGKDLLRVVIDPSLKLSLDKKVFRDKNVIVFCSADVSKGRLQVFDKAGIEVRKMSKSGNSTLSNLKFLAKRNIQSVFVEGGSGVHGFVFDSYLKNNKLIDKILFYIAPRLIGGGNSLSVIGGAGIDKLSKSVNFESLKIEQLSCDFKAEGRLNFY